jgi:hypothetical protein
MLIFYYLRSFSRAYYTMPWGIFIMTFDYFEQNGCQNFDQNSLEVTDGGGNKKCAGGMGASWGQI